MIVIYNGSGQVYQTILPNENDITYNDLIKYIKIPKHQEFDEINFDIKIGNTIFIETTIILFDNCCSHSGSYNEIKLNDEINKNELLVMFNYKYYILPYSSSCQKYYEIENDIKNYDNIFDAIKSNPYKLIFIDPQIENYEEICKLAVRQKGVIVQYVTEQTEEICQLAVQQNRCALIYVKEQTEEICHLAVQQNRCALIYVKEQTEEMCKLAVQQDGYVLQYVKNQTDEICKLAVKNTSYALEYVKNKTEEICKIAINRTCHALQYVPNKLKNRRIMQICS
jgi:hypothetical protein